MIHLLKGGTSSAVHQIWCGPSTYENLSSVPNVYTYREWVVDPALATCPACVLARNEALPVPVPPPSLSARARDRVRAVLMRGLSYAAFAVDRL